MFLNELGKRLKSLRPLRYATPLKKVASKQQRTLIMNLSLFSLALVCFQVAFAGKSTAQKVTLHEKEVSVVRLLKHIERQTGFTTFYKKKDLDERKRISVDLREVELREALQVILGDLECDFEIRERIIIIRKEEKEGYRQSASSPKNEEKIQQLLLGKVLDDGGAPLPGVTVSVRGLTVTTVTDENGDFRVDVDKGQVLVFSNVGYETQEVLVGDQNNLEIVLHATQEDLEEVVVVAFGTQKKATVTGAITSVGQQVVKSITTSDLSKGLAGRLPGIRVIQNSSEPGSFDTRFDIRGFSDPLFIVDGMEMAKRDFVRMNPNIIKDISVLKDASAAVYGVKAANGVVLVTTQKGEVGKPVISYSGDYEIQAFTNTLTPLDAYHYAVLNTEAEINNGIAPNATMFSPEDIQAYKDGTKPSTNWYDLVTRPYADKQRHNISVNGGSERIQYFTSVGYTGEDGMWRSGDLNYQKYDLRASVTGEITDNLKMSLSIDGMQDRKNEPGAPAFLPGVIGSMYFSLFMQVPTNPVYANNNPEYLQDSYDGQHPLAISTADIGGYTHTKLKTFQGNYTITYDVPFIDGLNASVRYGYYNLDQYIKRWAPKFQMYTYEESSDSYRNTATKNDPANLTGDYTTTQRHTLYGQLNYEKTWQKNYLNVTAVYEQKQLKNDNLSAYSEFDANVDQFFAGTRNHRVTSADIFEINNQNIISKINYSFDAKYLLESGFNFGGSSQFPEGSRWGLFPYASAGWVISRENFFKSITPLVTQLKLRGSWGKMGDDGAAAFQFLEGYDYPSGTYVFDDRITRGLGFRSIPNPNLTWSTSVTKNLGLDLEARNRLVYLSLDIFQRDRSGLLATRTMVIPATIGQSLSQENLNSDRTQGLEVVIGHARKSGDFQYDVSANMSFTRSRLIHIERNADPNSWENWRNNGMDRWNNIVWGYDYIGQFQSYEEILNSPLQGNHAQGNRFFNPGDLKYRDVNNDGLINRLDEIPIARGNTPEISFGIGNTFRYRQFDLDILLQGAANVNYLNDGPWYAREGIHWVGRNGLMKFTDRWHREDLFDKNSAWIPGRFPSTYSRGPGTPSTESNIANSTFWVNNSSYVRLKSVTFGYTFQHAFLTKIGVQSLRVVASGFNLITWTGLEDVDPERLQNLIYPNTKTYNLGVNLQI